MKNRLALLVAVLGFGTLVTVLLLSRDTKLQYQNQPKAPAAAESAAAPALSPTIETLAEVPAAAPEAAPAPEAPKPQPGKTPLPKTAAAKAKG